MIQWTHSDHQGVFPLQWLRENDYSNEESRMDKYKYSKPLIAVRYHQQMRQLEFN